MQFIELTHDVGTRKESVWINPDRIIEMSLMSGGTHIRSEDGRLNVCESPEEILEKCKPQNRPSVRIESLGNQVAELKTGIERQIQSGREMVASNDALQKHSMGLHCEVRKWVQIASQQEAEIQKLRQLTESLASAMGS